ncbi:MAG: hypothetical protein J0L70_23250 [Leptolyngbya sp. UWPOB_LEPTO1]|uniref:hypothetical protein n=1 Tax=Leptolyngbya sp. UWPOB_LEPTO1 TaxID=2815653 RepID=UPI001ACA02BE|nr:hypothetical protein [Leptolyngbya sp. UWPOB_LEPTO1]MBN8563458.1 hypothetical protein [Leptolyngbya sp. UWPOB_LEPTO1]
MAEFVNKQEAATYLRVSSSTLKRYRMEGEWIEGVHWIRVNCRSIRYNLDLIKDWLQNRHNPILHQQAIEQYCAAVAKENKRLKH